MLFIIGFAVHNLKQAEKSDENIRKWLAEKKDENLR